ncbi:MAG: beta strand repeat-containing protein, partial [bacterium]
SNPTPVTTSPLSPASVVAGSVRTALMLQVNGTGSSFVPGAVVRWNGMNRTTTFNDANQLTAAIPASDLVSAGTAMVTVFTPGPGGGTSNAQIFTINNPAPILSSISPTTVAQGSPGFTMTVVGANFVPGSVVRWNGAGRLTTFVGMSQLRAAIPASDVSAAGTAMVTVFTPGPGGGASNAQSLTISSSLVADSSQSSGPGPGAPSGPATSDPIDSGVGESTGRNREQKAPADPSPPVLLVAQPGLIPEVTQVEIMGDAVEAAGVILRVRGRNLLRGAVVRWNGEDLRTTYVDADELRAILPSTLTASSPTGSVTVINPKPNEFESFPFEFALR